MNLKMKLNLLGIFTIDLIINFLNLENITINHEADSSICSIVLPKIVEEAVPEEEEGEELEVEEEEGAEPEVITSKSKDEEEDQKEE